MSAALGASRAKKGNLICITLFGKCSPNCTPTNISPVVTPKTSSPDHQLSKLTDLKFIDQYVGQRLMEEKTRHSVCFNEFS